jgi:hypothetical protein
MREWLFALVPISLVAYFLLFPDQLRTFAAWSARLLLH